MLKGVWQRAPSFSQRNAASKSEEWNGGNLHTMKSVHNFWREQTSEETKAIGDQKLVPFAKAKTPVVLGCYLCDFLEGAEIAMILEFLYKTTENPLFLMICLILIFFGCAGLMVLRSRLSRDEESHKMALRLVEKAADDRRMAKTAEMLAPTTETVKGDSISAGVLIEVLRLSHGSQPSSTSCVPLSDSNSETRDAISIPLKPKG